MILRTLALLGFSAALAACASGPSDRGGRNDPIRALMSADAMLFVGFDRDDDLATSSAEIDAGLNREFTRADSNNDGSLSPIEFQNWSGLALGGSQMGPYRLDFDRNVDNTITREEWDSELRARVAQYDSDENTSLARSELIRLIGQARPPVERRRAVMTP